MTRAKKPARKSVPEPTVPIPSIDAHNRGLIDADLLHPHPRELPSLIPVPQRVEHMKEKKLSVADRKTIREHIKEFAVKPEPVKHDAATTQDAHARGLIDVDLLHARLAQYTTEKQEPLKAVPTPKHEEKPTPVVEHHSVKERFKALFSKQKTTETPPTTKPVVERNAGTPEAAPLQKEAPKSPFRRRPKVKAARKRLARKSLQEYLDKAGFEASADHVRKRTRQIVLALFILITVYVLIVSSLWGTGVWDVIIFMLGLWSAGFAGVFLLAQGIIYFFLDYTIYRRAREIELYLPDFLQLASSNIAAGMPIDRALWFSIRPSFGVLAKEMQEVAKATMAGEDLEASLNHFADKYESNVLRRSVSILIEGLRAGGEMADLLNKIALNIEEIKIMKQEMAANVTTYAIFITFASVVVAPFLFALATQLLQIIVGITGRLDLSSSSGFFTLNAADPEVIRNFKLFAVVMLIVSTMFSAALVSVIKRGNVLDGIKSIPVYAISSVIIYYVSLGVLNSAFGGIA